MNLYLLTQEEVSGYDTFDSAVVCAETEDNAKNIHPNGNSLENEKSGYCWPTEVTNIECKFLGVADNTISKGVVCASFNAG